MDRNKSLNKITLAKVLIGVQSERIRAIPSHSELLQKTFWISCDTNWLKNHPVQFRINSSFSKFYWINWLNCLKKSYWMKIATKATGQNFKKYLLFFAFPFFRPLLSLLPIIIYTKNNFCFVLFGLWDEFEFLVIRVRI